MVAEKIDRFFQIVVENNASDLHLQAGSIPVCRIEGELCFLQEAALTEAEMTGILDCLCEEKDEKTGRSSSEYQDFTCSKNFCRFRVHFFRSRAGSCLSFRSIPLVVPAFASLGLPAGLLELARKRHGLILITGATGSGKTTTAAALIDELNQNSARHIITLENPVEYLHAQKQSLISQREAYADFSSYQVALQAALREDPDVIFIGELRERETVETALLAAETGHLVMATMHTFDATEALLRLESLFSAGEKEAVRMQLSFILQGIAAQQLLPGCDGHRVCAVEFLYAVPAVRSLIREGRFSQILSQIQMGRSRGMQTMHMAIDNLQKNGKITKETARAYEKEALFTGDF